MQFLLPASISLCDSGDWTESFSVLFLLSYSFSFSIFHFLSKTHHYSCSFCYPGNRYVVFMNSPCSSQEEF